jgi:hypothetical protein
VQLYESGDWQQGRRMDCLLLQNFDYLHQEHVDEMTEEMDQDELYELCQKVLEVGFRDDQLWVAHGEELKVACAVFERGG